MKARTLIGLAATLAIGADADADVERTEGGFRVKGEPMPPGTLRSFPAVGGLERVVVRCLQFWCERPDDLPHRLRPFGWIETEPTSGAAFAILVPVDRGIVAGARFKNGKAFVGAVCEKLGVAPGTRIAFTEPTAVHRTW